MDPGYTPGPMESRTVYGLELRQERNAYQVTPGMFTNIVTGAPTLPEEKVMDLMIATIALKYTQSNSVCFAKGGQVIGLGAGQQSRIHW